MFVLHKADLNYSHPCLIPAATAGSCCGEPRAQTQSPPCCLGQFLPPREPSWVAPALLWGCRGHRTWEKAEPRTWKPRFSVTALPFSLRAIFADTWDHKGGRRMERELPSVGMHHVQLYPGNAFLWCCL